MLTPGYNSNADSILGTAIPQSIMGQWVQFVWLFKMAGEFVLFTPVLIVCALLSVSTALACVKQRPMRSGLWRSSYWLVLTQLLFYPALIAVAVLGGVNFRPVREPNKTALLYTDVLACASFALAVFWVWRMRGLRWLAVSLVLLEELLLLGAFVTAGMAISGGWL